MTTFSQLVDEIIVNTKRPDLAVDVISYVNQTMREMHFSPVENAAILYQANRKEIQLTATSEDNFTWTIPRMDLWQVEEAVRFDSVLDVSNRPIHPEKMVPGARMTKACHFYYIAGNYFSFSGYGGVNGIIKLSYFEFPRSLKYVLSDAREVRWDDDDGWVFTASGLSDAQKEAILLKNTNWLLQRWKTVIEEGIRAKVYKRAADEVRMRTSYSSFAQLRAGVFSTENARLAPHK